MSKKQNPISFFEIPVSDIQRGKRFYENVFSAEINISEMGASLMGFFPWIQEETGATGALIQGEGYTPSNQGTIIYFTVESIEGTLEKVEQNEGKVLLPKTDIGEHGFIAHFEDCEGNRVALHSVQ